MKAWEITKLLKETYPYGAAAWLVTLVGVMKRNGFKVEGVSIEWAYNNLSYKDWLDNYFMNGYSPQEAYKEDLKHA